MSKRMDTLINQALTQKSATGLLPGGQIRAGWISPKNHPAARKFRILNEYHMLYLIRGNGRVINGSGQASDLTPGAKLDRHPKLPHTLERHTHDQWLEFFITLSPSLHRSACDLGLLSPQRLVSHVPVTPQRIKVALQLVENMHQHMTPTNLTNQLIAMLSLFQNAAIQNQELETTDQLQHAAHLLSDLHHQQNTLPQIAQQVGMTYETFRKQFTKHFAKSPQQYRIDHRISQAQHHLLETDMSIEQLAEQLGYNDVFCFSRQFKTVCGMSPTQYRQRD